MPCGGDYCAGAGFCAAVRTELVSRVTVCRAGGISLPAYFLMGMAGAVLCAIFRPAHRADLAADTGCRAAAVVCQISFRSLCQKFPAVQAVGIPAVAFLLAGGGSRVPKFYIFVVTFLLITS